MAAMQKAGNRCESVGYEGRPRGFFSYGRSEGKHFEATLISLDKFPVSLGYFKDAATVGK